MSDSISVYMQVYSHKRAVFEALKSFRTFYKSEQITVLSDDGEDFSSICKAANARYIHSETRTTQGTMNIDGVHEWLRRIYEHCISVDSEWVLLFEEDVRTLRKIRTFPKTEAGGPRMNRYSPELTRKLIEEFGYKDYGYGLAGGAAWKRQAYIDAYNGNRNVDDYVKYDDRVAVWADIPLTLLFHINGFNYSEWEEISEITHVRAPIVRDSAFDHAYKYWCDKEFSEDLLDEFNS